MIKVAALLSDFGGCGFYRLIQPMHRLKKRGEVEVRMRATANGQGGMMPYLEQDDFEWADVVILQKAAGEELMPFIEKHRNKMVFEIDDDAFSVTKVNPAYTDGIARNPGFMERLKANIAACRLVTVTTDYLANVMRDVNLEVRVVTNGVDLERWRQPLPPPANDDFDPTEIRIGYLASRNHVEDVALLYTPMREIVKRYPHVKFVLAGAFYKDLKRILGDYLEYHDGAQINEYPEFARSLRLDIGVAPLVDSKFARSKSALKWYEYTALRIPAVMSDVGPYHEEVFPDMSGFLAKNGDDFVAMLSALIESEDMRKTMAEKADVIVSACYTADNSADEWLEVLKEVAA